MSRMPLVKSPVPLPKTSTRAMPPLELSKKKMPLPWPPFKPPLAIRVALAAVALWKKYVTPPSAKPLTVPPCLNEWVDCNLGIRGVVGTYTESGISRVGKIDMKEPSMHLGQGCPGNGRIDSEHHFIPPRRQTVETREHISLR